MANLWVRTQAKWSEPDEDDWRNARPSLRGRSPEELHGAVRHVDEYFQGHPTAPAPWRSTGSMGTRTHLPYERAKVREVLSQPPVLEDVDPRHLVSTQPSITRAGVQHYLDEDHQRTGRTFADHGNVGNMHPVVYKRDDGVNLLLSGHHRATVALFEGRPLRARVVRGGMEPR